MVIRRHQSQSNPIITASSSSTTTLPDQPCNATARAPTSDPLAMSLPNNDNTTMLEDKLRDAEARLQSAESRIRRLKTANRMSIAAKDDEDLDIRMRRISMNDDIMSLHETKAHLEEACNALRLRRDQLITEISNYLDHLPHADIDIDTAAGEEDGNKGGHQDDKRAAMIEQLKGVFVTELQSIRTDIHAAKSEYERLLAARDEILNEMILLNTKNAELNEINNDLARRMSEREREAAAFMAGTNFLDSAGKKEASPSGGNAPGPISTRRLKKLKHRRIMFFGRSASASSSTASLPAAKDGDVVEEEEEEEEDNDDHHRFRQAKFLMLTRCDACGEKMWKTAELKCQVCGVVCHTQCASALMGGPCNGRGGGEGGGSAPPPVPAKEEDSMVFGNDLSKQVHMENGQVPVIVCKCVEAVEARGMDCEGIYRKSGGATQMRHIQQLFDHGTVPDLSNDVEWNDIYAITSILKQYFRNLPDPLFTYELHDAFIQAILNKDLEERLVVFRNLLHTRLPRENYETLWYLVRHLNRVQEQQEENLMSIRNLAVIFGPTLLRNPDEGKDLLEMNRKIEIVDYILSHPDTLFEQLQEQ